MLAQPSCTTAHCVIHRGRNSFALYTGSDLCDFGWLLPPQRYRYPRSVSKKDGGNHLDKHADTDPLSACQDVMLTSPAARGCVKPFASELLDFYLLPGAAVVSTRVLKFCWSERQHPAAIIPFTATQLVLMLRQRH